MDAATGAARLGVWVRDSTAGVGTLSFYDPDTGTYAALGHAITDGDTGEVLTVDRGQILKADIVSVQKGEKGSPGELKGSFLREGVVLGDIARNNILGIYGSMNEAPQQALYPDGLPIGLRSGVHTGKASILSTVSGEGLKEYEVEITRVNPQTAPAPKSMVLRVTDPELLEIFENFAFDEVMEHGKLDEKTRMLVILASLIAQQTLSEYKTMLEAALNVGVKPIEVKELVYQSVPYCGFAKVVDFIDSTNEILIKRGIELPLKRQATITRETRYEKGFALQKEIFGDEAIETMYRNCPDNQLPIQRFLSDNCFGDYYTRQGLDLPMRELLTFSMILSLGGCEPQLKGHIQGNANVGNDKEMLFDVIVQLLPYLGYPRTLNAIRCLNEALPDEQ